MTDAFKSLANRKPVLGYEFNRKTYNIGSKEVWIMSFFELARRDIKSKI